jgi:hypothetical protein
VAAAQELREPTRARCCARREKAVVRNCESGRNKAQSSQLNQTIAITAISVQAQIKLLDLEIQKFSKSMKDAFKVGDTAGVVAAQQQVARLINEKDKLIVKTKADTAATQQNTRAHRESALTMREATKYVNEFGRIAGVTEMTSSSLGSSGCRRRGRCAASSVSLMAEQAQQRA